ncbi:uncharacterized protein LOC123979875 [Micropterus dolomieu]|uniref:uncharacterized protein LOC123979875 n=1 Tax=Micropterus dolomieu TaxID=147949 RepID=UPI001E8DE58F|nr:uncharacterized protein LOC123979875 [Micropterus dolomieu]
MYSNCFVAFCNWCFPLLFPVVPTFHPPSLAGVGERQICKGRETEGEAVFGGRCVGVGIQLSLCGETNTCIMSLSLLLLLLLLVCSTQASHYYGSVMSYYPKTTNADGSITVDLHYNLNIHCGSVFTVLTCSSNNCGTAVVHSVSKESDILTWCQNEGLVTLQVPPNAPFQLLLSGGAWINFIRNSIGSVKAVTLVEPRNRSDTSQANRSPQTNILALVRVPSNCPRDFNLLMFDPDGDQVKCRYANSTLSECDQCTPPSVLNLSTPSTSTHQQPAKRPDYEDIDEEWLREQRTQSAVLENSTLRIVQEMQAVSSQARAIAAHTRQLVSAVTALSMSINALARGVEEGLGCGEVTES